MFKIIIAYIGCLIPRINLKVCGNTKAQPVNFLALLLEFWSKDDFAA